MSAAQALASSRFLNAMGPMIMDEKKMVNVLSYIIALRASDEPCRFTEEDIVAFADKAERDYIAGKGMMSHSDFMQEVATWH